MNIFRFLKSTQGAIKPLNALIISGAAGVGFLYVANIAADRHIESKRAVRSLSSVSQTAPQAGMLRRGNLLTSINVRAGRSQLATAQERAAMKGTSALDRYVANQEALKSLDDSLARAAQFADSDAGLNTGNRETVQAPTRLVVGNPNANRAEAVADGAASSSAAQRQSGFSSSSITRASGNPFGGSGAVTGGIVAQGGEQGQRLSGSMPGGSNIVSQRGLDGALAGGRSTANFGTNHDGRLIGGTRSKGERDELKDIVKRSADAAGNPDSSANEGGRAFLANANNSGGVNVGEGEDMTRGASSGDLTAPTNNQLKAVGNKISDLDKELAERQSENRRLRNLLIATVLGSIAMMVAGAILLPKLHGFWRVAVAAAMCAAVAAANTVLFVKAVEFIDRYNSTGGTGLAKLAVILSPIMVAGMVYTAIKPQGWKGLGGKIWGNVKKAFEPVGMLTGQVTNGIMGLFNK
ncbi:MAG: hypothetical protein J6Y17_00875 [Elusimicrobiaceae bacterium]|nr:hypothetical protein [Elusimicrobiaceae bacterium]